MKKSYIKFFILIFILVVVLALLDFLLPKPFKFTFPQQERFDFSLAPNIVAISNQEVVQAVASVAGKEAKNENENIILELDSLPQITSCEGYEGDCQPQALKNPFVKVDSQTNIEELTLNAKELVGLFLLENNIDQYFTFKNTEKKAERLVLHYEYARNFPYLISYPNNELPLAVFVWGNGEISKLEYNSQLPYFSQNGNLNPESMTNFVKALNQKKLPKIIEENFSGLTESGGTAQINEVSLEYIYRPETEVFEPKYLFKGVILDEKGREEEKFQFETAVFLTP